MKCNFNNQNSSASIDEYFVNLANSLHIEEMLSKFIDNIPNEYFWEISGCICLEAINQKVDINKIKDDIFSRFHTKWSEDKILVALFCTLIGSTGNYALNYTQNNNALLDELSGLVSTHFNTLMSINRFTKDMFGVSLTEPYTTLRNFNKSC